jgi:hypothetical protein
VTTRPVVRVRCTMQLCFLPISLTVNCYGPGKLDYCVTPEPIRRTDWGLYVSECKLVVLKMRRADLIIDDLLSMLCLKLDDVFYVRTEGDRAITVRDLSNGKMLMPEPPGVSFRQFTFIWGRT